MIKQQPSMISLNTFSFYPCELEVANAASFSVVLTGFPMSVLGASDTVFAVKSGESSGVVTLTKSRGIGDGDFVFSTIAVRAFVFS